MKKKAEKAAAPDGSMSLSGHLRELRNRILVCVILLVAVFGLCLTYASHIVTLLTNMGQRYDYTYVYIAPQELFLVYLNVALVGAVVVCFPVLAYQVYAFCSPGLTGKERAYISGALIAGALCFLVGVAFAYFISPALSDPVYGGGGRLRLHQHPAVCGLSDDGVRHLRPRV